MEILIFIILVIAGLIWLKNSTFGTERWCEHCGKWGNMKLRGDFFICESCGKRNYKAGGCPKCGWYGKYENRLMERVGPIVEQDLFQTVVYYREWWNCPHHGQYEIKELVNSPIAQQSSISYGNYESYDDEYNNDYEYYDDDSNYESSDHWGPV